MNANFYNYRRAFEGLNKMPADVDKSKDLIAWQKRAGVTRSAWKQVKTEHDAAIAEINATYTPAAAAEKIADENEAFNEITKIARERMVEGLEEVLDAKRKAFDKANAAPSDAAVRMLSVLALRTSVEADEIASLTEQFETNLPALRALRDIAVKNGVAFPSIISTSEFESNIEKARGFAMERINSMDKDEYNSYADLAFWKYPGSGPSVLAFAPLDTNRFTVTAKEPEPAPEAETEENKTEGSTNVE